MQLPLTDPDTLFEELLQDLPLRPCRWRATCKAFVRAKKVKTPEQLLRVVFLYCGLDKSLREVAGTFTALYESMTDQSVAERLRACGPWVQALLRRMLPLAAVETPARRAALCGHRRQQYASPRSHRHRPSPAYRDGLGVLAVSRGVGQRCPHRRNAQAFHLGARRCRRGRPRLCPVPRHACGGPAGGRSHRTAQSLQCGTG